MTTTDQTLTVVIQDADGNEINSFPAQDDKSFVQMAEEHDIEMPVSCCSGACFVCACHVVEGQEAVDIGKISVPLVDIDKDQVLSCVGGVKTEFFANPSFSRIVLRKLM